MKNKKNLEYRMYGLVPYNISPIQQGIQYGHAVVEYGLKYFNDRNYKKWANRDKTFIILNGGTTNNNHPNIGTLNQHLETLINNKIKLTTFHEPDLGDQLTAIVFLVDERVFNKDKYKEVQEYPGDCDWIEELSTKELKKIVFLREFLSKFKLA